MSSCSVSGVYRMYIVQAFLSGWLLGRLLPPVSFTSMLLYLLRIRAPVLDDRIGSPNSAHWFGCL